MRRRAVHDHDRRQRAWVDVGGSGKLRVAQAAAKEFGQRDVALAKPEEVVAAA